MPVTRSRSLWAALASAAFLAISGCSDSAQVQWHGVQIGDRWPPEALHTNPNCWILGAYVLQGEAGTYGVVVALDTGEIVAKYRYGPKGESPEIVLAASGVYELMGIEQGYHLRQARKFLGLLTNASGEPNEKEPTTEDKDPPKPLINEGETVMPSGIRVLTWEYVCDRLGGWPFDEVSSDFRRQIHIEYNHYRRPQFFVAGELMDDEHFRAAASKKRLPVGIIVIKEGPVD